ncbi:hypothetical protein NUW54_g11322 [Trametes sanguinea]|uniref:Uncharacterized protein n=1 Tax=Trametes sanguinea TaxID=158606 RepID=A0ACC1NGK7_9APHY|nr:hypothetical protein NUW54_g11322 [Trametes sanguinea]
MLSDTVLRRSWGPDEPITAVSPVNYKSAFRLAEQIRTKVGKLGVFGMNLSRQTPIDHLSERRLSTCLSALYEHQAVCTSSSALRRVGSSRAQYTKSGKTLLKAPADSVPNLDGDNTLSAESCRNELRRSSMSAAALLADCLVGTASKIRRTPEVTHSLWLVPRFASNAAERGQVEATRQARWERRRFEERRSAFTADEDPSLPRRGTRNRPLLSTTGRQADVFPSRKNDWKGRLNVCAAQSNDVKTTRDRQERKT